MGTRKTALRLGRGGHLGEGGGSFRESSDGFGLRARVGSGARTLLHDVGDLGAHETRILPTAIKPHNLSSHG